VVLLGVAAVVVAAWTLLAMFLGRADTVSGRLAVYDEHAAELGMPDGPPVNEVTTVPILKRAVALTGDLAERRGILEQLEADLERANLPLRAAEALFFALVGGVLAAILVFLLTKSILMALVVLVVAALLPKAVINFRIGRRTKAFEQQLPDMLDLLAGTLRAGYSIGQGIEAVSREIGEPMSRELQRVVNEHRLGRSLEESLEGVAERMQSDDFAWAVMAIRIQREVGGNLAELLLTVSNTMTQRERLRRDVASLTAEGKMSAMVLGLMPFILGMVMFVINKQYVMALLTPGLGYMMLGGALVSMVIGFIWMKKMITVEV
jgi:tight adherence protein B